MDRQLLAWPDRWLKLKRFCRKNCAVGPLSFARLKAKGRDNRVLAEALSVNAAAHCIIRFEGNGNTVELGDLKIRGILKIVVCGDNNRVVIRDGTEIVSKLQMDIWQGCREASVTIDRGCTFWETAIRNTDHGSSVTIGEGSIFSKQTVISNTDEHAILVDGQVINRAGALRIGAHVWIGQGASLMKNCVVPDGCIVARNAVVTHAFEAPRCVLAGMPARAVKHGVEWDLAPVNSFLDTCRSVRGNGSSED